MYFFYNLHKLNIKYVCYLPPIVGVYSGLWACDIVVMLSYRIESEADDTGKALWVS